MFALAAYYAPRGIPLDALLTATPAEQAFLQAAREMHNKELFWLLHDAVLAAMNPDAAKEAAEIYG